MYYPIVHGTLSDTIVFSLSSQSSARRWFALHLHLFYTDNLKGSVETIGAVHPHSQVQRCIVQQIRSSTQFVSNKDIKLS
ncbi:MAG: hypothetical protein HDT37_05265 [Clostridiales bacterium]|nr:hypothetical protein [Clostridiales bacterium]